VLYRVNPATHRTRRVHIHPLHAIHARTRTHIPNSRSPLQLIASKPRRGRGGRSGRGRSGAGSATADASGAGGARARYSGSAPRSSGSRAPAAPAPAAKPLTADAIKIIISNLPADVTEPQVRDLMQSTVGPVRTVQMSYTSTGKSTGVATVLFKNKGDANKAHAKCESNNPKRRSARS